jgi:hypothetical protein
MSNCCNSVRFERSLQTRRIKKNQVDWLQTIRSGTTEIMYKKKKLGNLPVKKVKKHIMKIKIILFALFLATSAGTD